MAQLFGPAAGGNQTPGKPGMPPGGQAGKPGMPPGAQPGGPGALISATTGMGATPTPLGGGPGLSSTQPFIGPQRGSSPGGPGAMISGSTGLGATPTMQPATNKPGNPPGGVASASPLGGLSAAQALPMNNRYRY